MTKHRKQHKRRRRTTAEADSGRKPERQAAEPWFQGKRPVLRFVVVFGLVLGLFHAAFFAHLTGAPLFDRYLAANAEVAGMILRAVGYDTTVEDNVISGRGASITIIRGCDALQPIALFVAAVVALPAGFRTKPPGVALGVLALLALNMLRIVSLYYCRLNHPRAFDIMHYDVWQAVFILAAILLWVVWAQRALRRPERTIDESAEAV
ncbi:MAG: hypothetical protein GY842_08590 [bacterium]|nr:hypothetical protein [bacterium]